ncbi:chromate transporter [Aquabacter spiritensis]|uniref:Chromate transporter n=1 Tax=Aquabacter spiritensis TaxID=933073 RepID=A0A4R3LVN3_9HYPH|nr:chromate transporter [Aquabacter spiritensis]TCT04700.1 chromate transporter [Aquabacter spiritensis]
MMPRDPLLDLTLHVFFVSFLAIGGANAIIPELHRMAVESNGWMSDGTFADLFAIATMTPGPNVLLVTLIGWYVAGIPGAVLSTLVMCVPTGAAAYYMSRLSRKFQKARPRIAIQRGLAALTVGIVLASAFILMRSTAHDWVAYAITAAAAAVTIATKANPIVMIAAGAVVGALGFV